MIVVVSIVIVLFKYIRISAIASIALDGKEYLPESILACHREG